MKCPCRLNRVAYWCFHGEPTFAWWVAYAVFMFAYCAAVAAIGRMFQ